MAYMAEFNPFSLLYDGFTGLVKYLTDFDLAAIISEKVRAMMSVLPDWVVEKLGVNKLSLILISEPTRPYYLSYSFFCFSQKNLLVAFLLF